MPKKIKFDSKIIQKGKYVNLKDLSDLETIQ